VKAEYAAKLQAAEARVRDIESARDEAKQQVAALKKDLETSQKTAQQVRHYTQVHWQVWLVVCALVHRQVLLVVGM
jgi:hypothetical protein